MADQKLTQLTALASLSADDLFYVVDDPAGAALSRKMTASVLDSRYLQSANNLSDLANTATARSNLSLVIGTNVQAWDADLDTIAGLAKADGNFIVGDGATWTVESGATARGSLGLGSLAVLSSPLPIANGGSGQVTQQAAIDALTAVSGATDEHVLTKDTASGNAIFKVSGSGTTLPVADTQAIVKGSADATKLLRFEIDGFNGGATRVMTPPNQDTLLAGQNFLNVFTVNQTFQADLISDRGLGGNRFFAGGAGNATMSGDEIVGIGAGAIDSNTTGARNFALGTNALTSNTTGNDNTAIGIDSLKANQAGVQHLAIGKGTLESMNGGQDNIAIGTFALQNMVNSLSIANIAIGSGTMRNITSEALNNVAIGFETMGNGGAASCGNENTAVGYKTMSLINSTSAEKNTGVGAISMLFISSGARNVGIGWGAGFSLTSGSGNVFIGVQAGYNVTTQSNQLHIANLQTDTPLIYGEFDNGILKFHSTVNSDAVVNTLSLVRRRGSGTPGAGLGSALRCGLHSSTTEDQDAGRLYWLWPDAAGATHATRRAAGVLTAYSVTTERECLSWEATSTEAKLSFLGATRIGRPATYTLAATATRTMPTPEATFTGQDNAQVGNVYAKFADLATLQTRLDSVEGVLRQLIIDLASTSGYGLLVAS